MTHQKVVRIANPFKPAGKTRNPGLLVTLSPAAAANPHKKGHKQMKNKTGKAKNALAVAAKPKSKPKKNPTYAVVPAKQHAKKPKKSNPNDVILFGKSFQPIDLVKIFFGGLVGVAATKLIAARMPAELTSTPFAKVLTSGAVAFATGFAGMRMEADFGAGMLFGGGMQTASVALNGFLPEVGSRLSLNGLGDLLSINGYPMPYNPVTAGSNMLLPPPAAASDIVESANTMIPNYESSLYQ